jgi:adenylosuccinate synthase
MPVVVVVGAQWGDEGKGKVIDLYTRYADVVARYGGGANAGHTLVVGGEKTVFHLMPSGALHPEKTCVLAQGMVVDPAVLLDELRLLEEKGLAPFDRTLLSDRAHVVLPHHVQVDRVRDLAGGGIGTTHRGIGPCYEDKVGRRGVRAGDLLHRDKLEANIHRSLERWSPVLRALGEAPPDPGPIVDRYLELGAALRSTIADTSRALSERIDRGDRVLFEGAQGTLLDIDHGTYPYVTSSNVVAGGASCGAGIGPSAIERVVGIAKAYATRVGGGPFPTELHGDAGDRLRAAGDEFGATTGRPRRCGWLDIPALRFACRVNGLAELALTKLDVLSGLPELRVCTAYELDGRRLDEPPYDDLDRVTPVYETLPGFRGDLAACSRREDLPEAARRYVDRIEELVGRPVGTLSLGPDREQTLGLVDPFAGL